MKNILLLFLLLSTGICCTFAKGNKLSDLKLHAQKITSENVSESDSAIVLLRNAGPEGLQIVAKVHAEQLEKLRTDIFNKSELTPELKRLKVALDKVAQQYDSYSSLLYWYTDLEQAKAASKTSGKPILSLRLLGNLNEEYCCANSRFFRTALYANQKVSLVLRENFVLHWKSVRPVPKISIDFGDGRKLNQTITGNSIHYVLDSEGRPIDALPGLYGPRAFLRELEQARAAAIHLTSHTGEKHQSLLREYHANQLQEISIRWAADIVAVNPSATSAAILPANNIDHQTGTGYPLTPTAADADRVSKTKSVVEFSKIRAITPSNTPRWESLIESNKTPPSTSNHLTPEKTEDAIWKRIAQLHQEDARLDSNSSALMESKSSDASEASRVAVGKATMEAPFLRTIRTFERSMAEDTVRNEYLLHSKIHEWFVNGSASSNVEVLNERVYAELFLTPSSDPWLGLVPRDVFTALENNGIQ